MMNLALPGLETGTVRADDIILTPDDVARDVVRRFAPAGRVLDPCKGEGAFLRHMPGADWCEIREGRDFFAWTEPVDWIVSNPPYSIFADFLRHAFRVAQDIVFLIPVNKAFNSDRMMREIWTWGGIPTVYVIGGGGALGFPIGFCIGAVHFRRGYRDGMRVEFRIPNASLDRPAASAGTVGGLVGGSVFLAYYHTGFTDDPPELLDVCDSEASAAAVIEAHKRNRDSDCEYEDKATWWTKARAVRTANAHALAEERSDDSQQRVVGATD